MTIDERIEALVMSVEPLTRDVETLRATAQIDAENIRAFVHIAEIHERRITGL
jgi:hypothetical protein